MTEHPATVPITIRRRTPAERARYLALQLNLLQSDMSDTEHQEHRVRVLGIAMALDALAEDIAGLPTPGELERAQRAADNLRHHHAERTKWEQRRRNELAEAEAAARTASRQADHWEQYAHRLERESHPALLDAERALASAADEIRRLKTIINEGCEK